ncbi:T9SS type A sorting domain-containing protein [Psychroserpens luteolus]|uniref:T9SS type A sorting domain-containing protein n=1 Tax=Psychroserpens luteolus TaxID=2855840 RepID=UPI001E3E8765|nr:T9SS type A sorting domain-containing protein [Psychroserpens luteolus]MCD2260773.1 T9SS type A sorting domain-containing protein [Psychroserpens luteolus]
MKKKIFLIITLLASLVSFSQEISTNSLTSNFNGSGGLSLDSEGNLYIGDFGDFLSAGDNDGLPNNVWKLDTNLNLTVFSPGFVGASGNAFDSEGTLYQSDIGNSSIYKIVNGVRTFVTSTGISAPVGLVFDSQGNLFVCNCGANSIQKITFTLGVVTSSSTFASGAPTFFCPNGLTIDENDNLYVSNFSNGNIVKITPAGIPSILITTPGGTTSGPSNGHLDYHQATNTLFIASHGSNRIYSLELDQALPTLNTIAGSGVRGNTDNENALLATFSRPNGVAVTQTGDSIYINSAIPVTNFPSNPLNPQVIRLIKGVQSGNLSVESVNPSSNFKTYPNPVKDTFTLESETPVYYKDLNIKLFDLKGKLIKEINAIKPTNGKLKIEIDLSSLAAGTYLYTIYNNSDAIKNGKLIKE